MKTQRIITLAVVAVVAAGVIIWLALPNRGPEVTEGSPSPTPDASVSPSATFIGLTGLTQPASCAVGGSITFMEPNLSRSDDATVSWKNVDIKGRHIDWTVTPNDGLAVGPNFFEALPIPNGSSAITVSLPASPKAKQYTLRAAVTYGQMIDGNAQVKSSPCAGSVTVTIGY